MKIQVMIAGMIMGLGCSSEDEKLIIKPASFSSQYGLTTETFDHCKELQQVVADQEQARLDDDFNREFYRDYLSARRRSRTSQPSSNDKSPDLASASNKQEQDADESFTNIQEQGIDEADFVKIGRYQIFVHDGERIMVSNRETLAYIDQIDIGDLREVNMFVHGDRLAVLGQKGAGDRGQGRWVAKTQRAQFDLSSRRTDEPAETIVSIYKLEKDSTPKLLEKKTFKGSYRDSRFVDGKLILVSTARLVFKSGVYKSKTAKFSYINSTESNTNFDIEKGTISKNPVNIVDGKVAGIRCENIVKQSVIDMDYRMTRVTTIDVRSREEKSLGLLGAGNQIYMAAGGLYITKSGLSWTPFKVPNKNNSVNNWFAQTQGLVIVKISFEKDSYHPYANAMGMILGSPKDQYSFKEYTESGALAVATTTAAPLPDGELDRSKKIYELFEGKKTWKQGLNSDLGRNHMWVLKQKGSKLELEKSITNFGEPGEDIRSVRYADDHAYVVTFKKTDPLYSFDMKDPLNFEMVGKLKIPGFSMYMHPAKDHTIGVGYDASEHGDFALYQGIQISLFNIADPTDVVRVDNKIHGERGSSSEVTGNPHAFFYSEENNLFALPVIELGDHSGSRWDWNMTLKFSGAVVYEIQGDSLLERARLSHDEFIPESCLRELAQTQWWQNSSRSRDINRIYEVDGHLLTVSRYGLKQYSLDNLDNPVVSTEFPDAAQCVGGFSL